MNFPFLLQIFKTRFKTAATPSFWIAFVLLISGVLALGFIFNREDGLRVRVGVLRPQTSLTENFLERFRYYADNHSEIIIYGDEEQMKLDVSAHKLECAYVFNDGRVVAYRSPQTTADKILDITVAAVYTEKLAGELGSETLERYLLGSNVNGGLTMDSLSDEIQRMADEYLKDGSLMEIEYTELNAPGGIDAAERAPYYRLFHGLVGLAALLPALLCAMGMKSGADKPAERRLNAAGLFTAAAFLVVFVLVSLFMAAAFAAGGALFPGVVSGWRGELLNAVSLAWAAAGLAVLLSVIVPADAFPAVVSFVFIFASVFGGAVFDMREVMEAAAPAGYLFPNYYYINGNWTALLVIGTVCGGAAVAISEGLIKPRT